MSMYQNWCFSSLCFSLCVAVCRITLLQVINKWDSLKQTTLEFGPEFDLTIKLAIVLPFLNPRQVFKAYSIWASRSHYSSPEKFSLGPWHFQRTHRPGTMCSMFVAMGWGLQDAQRGVGVVFCPSWTDKLITSACFVNGRQFNGRTDHRNIQRDQMRTEMDDWEVTGSFWPIGLASYLWPAPANRLVVGH